MKINFQNTSLAITAGLELQFPKDNRPQIIFSGRSNVGKSSLLNTLIGRKSLARVSSAPGKTVTVNFYDIDGKMYFVDLPGYGYAKRTPQEKEKFTRLTNGFLTSNSTKHIIIQLIDMKTGPTEDDYMMLDWLDATECPYFITATKSDKLNKTDFNNNYNELLKLGAKVIPFSALSGAGRDAILGEILDFIK